MNESATSPVSTFLKSFRESTTLNTGKSCLNFAIEDRRFKNGDFSKFRLPIPRDLASHYLQCHDTNTGKPSTSGLSVCLRAQEQLKAAIKAQSAIDGVWTDLKPTILSHFGCADTAGATSSLFEVAGNAMRIVMDYDPDCQGGFPHRTEQ